MPATIPARSGTPLSRKLTSEKCHQAPSRLDVPHRRCRRRRQFRRRPARDRRRDVSRRRQECVRARSRYRPANLEIRNEGDQPPRPFLLAGRRATRLRALSSAWPATKCSRSTPKPESLSIGFGEGGFVSGVSPASAPVIYHDLIISGENRVQSVRALDAHTGKLVWTFYTKAQPGEPGHETWQDNSLDAKRRHGRLEFHDARCRARHRLHADPSQRRHGILRQPAPRRRTLQRQPRRARCCDRKASLVPAARPSRSLGLRRSRRRPLSSTSSSMAKRFPASPSSASRAHSSFSIAPMASRSSVMEERPVPQTTVPGEATSPTQPFPLKPPPLAPTSISKTDIYNLTPEHAAFCQESVGRRTISTTTDRSLLSATIPTRWPSFLRQRRCGQLERRRIRSQTRLHFRHHGFQDGANRPPGQRRKGKSNRRPVRKDLSRHRYPLQDPLLGPENWLAVHQSTLGGNIRRQRENRRHRLARSLRHG